MREMYRKDGGAFPDPILNLTWNYTNPIDPDPEELAKDMNGRALVGYQGRRRARSRCAPASCWTASPSCATTARPRRAAGSSRAATPRRATRWPVATRPTRASRASRRTGPGRGRPTGASSTIAPAPTSPGKPGTRTSRSSSGTAAGGSASTCPTMRRPPSRPTAVGPFIMNAEGVGRLFARDQMAEGPFPEHYEPFESPSPNVLHPKVQIEPGGAGVRRRPGGVRDRVGLPLRGDHLPADRAFPLLDQARADQRDPAAARSSSRSAKSWRRRRASSRAAGCG